MEALKLAFDTIIVGVLALPWLILVDSLYYSGRTVGWFILAEGGEPAIDEASQPAKDKPSRFAVTDPIIASVAGIVLIASAYFIGSAVSRIAQDFLSDDHIPIVTDDSIRTRVYCDASLRKSGDARLLAQMNWSVIADHVFDLDSRMDRTNPDLLSNCPFHKFQQIAPEAAAQLQWFVQQIFYLQEAALLQRGEEKTNRISQLHEQTIVLRGAAFDGLVALALCAFGWGAATYPRVWIVFPAIILAYGSWLFKDHVASGSFTEPPYAEITMVILGISGGVAMWRGINGYLKSPRHYERLFWPLLVLTPMAYFSWWWTEVLYDQLILYSFVALPPAQ